MGHAGGCEAAAIHFLTCLRGWLLERERTKIEPGARSKFLLKYQAPRASGDAHELKLLNGTNAYNIISDGKRS